MQIAVELIIRLLWFKSGSDCGICNVQALACNNCSINEIVKFHHSTTPYFVLQASTYKYSMWIVDAVDYEW